MQYKQFLLDQFQIDAIAAIEDGKSVVVSAPTGAGKTLIAEYLIEKFLKEDKRIIYTAPIKALSNQKYRDFKGAWGQKVGILTGDVAINERAPVLIMTTEIFRNMLMNDLEALEGVMYVIFDEIHYINDIERGVIWEESIIFAPPEMRFLALSATIPNAASLGGWISHIKKQEVQVISYHQRPVPLRQYVYDDKNGLFPLVEFKKTLSRQQQPQKRGGYHPFPFSFYRDLIKKLQQDRLLPALFFIFSREATYNFGWEAYRSFSFSTPEEREKIGRIFDTVIGDPELLQVDSIRRMKKLVLEGIGVHNAGLLPILKEAVEVLFTEKLLKLLFVTETFALGVNMPAKTVVFHSLEKYDGLSFRYLMSREFFQMGGRAGRRGIDEFGVNISIIPQNLDTGEFQRITDEQLEPLESQFKLSYNTILNLIKKHSEDEIIHIINMSFHQFQSNYERIRTEEQVGKIRGSLKNHGENLFHDCRDWGNIRKYLKSKEQVDYLRKYLWEIERQVQKIRIKRLKRKKLSERDWAAAHFDQQMTHHTKLSCTSCPHLQDCLGSYKKIRQDLRDLSYFEKQLKNISQIDQVEIFHKKRKLLSELGYLSLGKITARGETGSLVYGYELIITELLYEAVFEISPEPLINMLLGAILFERPKKGELPKFRHQDPETRRTIQRARKIAHRIRSMEQSFLGEKTSPIINNEIMPLIEMWCAGRDFSELTSSFPMEEGDIIRLFRAIIDLLRQLVRVTREYEALRNKFKRCIDLMDRDIVSLSYYLKEEKPVKPEPQPAV
ncbi:MAG: DEAD/DEAH box helicase [Candidatus Wallbacteria bacterium]|nr:DEAD/DEAH box helicase [Candidatus Wallbacteria bacterium]